MSKALTPLEALERLRPKTTYQPYYTKGEKRHYCDIIENALKRAIEIGERNAELCEKERALEIIKDLPKEEKQILLNAIYSYTKDEEKYDLLKEVLL